MEIQPNAVNLICQVCGSNGARIHYRAVACGSCKIFFVRTVQRTSGYLCENGSTCVVTKDNRNSCKACRFAKCLKANMTEQDVGRFKKNSECNSKNDAVVPYIADSQWKAQFEKQKTMDTFPPCALGSDAYNLNQIPEAVSIGAHFVRDLVRTSKASEYAKTLVYIESLCDNNEAPKSSFAYSLDASLADVLQKPHLCCTRTPTGWNDELFVEQDNVLDILKQVYCRTITHFADFVASCPELQMLSSKDKLALCSTNYCGVVLLLMSYNAYLNNCEGILFPHGFKYSLSRKREDHEYNVYLHELVEYLYRNVISTFQEILVTVEEYAIIKALVLFSGGNLYVSSIDTLFEAWNMKIDVTVPFIQLLCEYLAATSADFMRSFCVPFLKSSLLQSRETRATSTGKFRIQLLQTLPINTDLREQMSVHRFKISKSKDFGTAIGASKNQNQDNFIPNVPQIGKKKRLPEGKEKVMSLSDEGSEIASKARRKYGALLSDYVMTTRADLSTADQMARVSKLYSIIPHMMHASESDNIYCARMVMMNLGNMNGSLSFDLHVRKF